jgi:hypothetical protein
VEFGVKVDLSNTTYAVFKSAVALLCANGASVLYTLPNNTGATTQSLFAFGRGNEQGDLTIVITAGISAAVSDVTADFADAVQVNQYSTVTV